MRIKQKNTRNTFFNSFEQVQEELHRPSIGLRVLLGILLIAVILIGTVWQKVNVTQLAQEIEQLEKQKQSLEEKSSLSHSERLKLSNGKRVVQIAKLKRKMDFPDSELVPLQVKYHESDLNDYTR